MKKITTLLFILLSLPIMAIDSKKEHPFQPPMYTIDFGGANFMYLDPRTNEPPKSIYFVGEEVCFRLEIWATDTRYTFYLDGQEINATHDEKYGYCFRFPMPDHDVKFSYATENTMVYDPHEQNKSE